MMTLMIGNPGETDQDMRETLDLVYEMDRRGLFAFLCLRSSPLCTTRAWSIKRASLELASSAHCNGS